ncbi:uncharacterized protein KGF55_000742 [Candida pseudojiufengensis]|uniref:uncharacterized protein n=1 Tax=Candida pseudojiufengensis TaxID=497109 RepID=UPI0022256EA3|nr:uncharacterized protein KGF55_000742 [Candida pseudojiufengensis]KAI5966433.1 hypothetical protein KGF55_000742 [Candida pseudojiufengensis]
MTKTIQEILHLRENEISSTTESKERSRSHLSLVSSYNSLSKRKKFEVDSDNIDNSIYFQIFNAQTKICTNLIDLIFEEKPLSFELTYLSVTQACCEKRENSNYIKNIIDDKLIQFWRENLDTFKEDAAISSLHSDDNNVIKYNDEEVIKACEVALECWNRYEKILEKLEILFKVTSKFEDKIKGSPYEMGINYFNRFCFTNHPRELNLFETSEEDDRDLSYFWILTFMDQLFVLLTKVYLKDKYFEKSKIQVDISSFYEKFITFIKMMYRYSEESTSSFEIIRHAIHEYFRNSKYDNLNGRCDFRGSTKTKTMFNIIDEEVKFAKKFHEDNIDAQEYDIFLTTPLFSHNLENNKQMIMDVCELTSSFKDIQRVFDHLYYGCGDSGIDESNNFEATRDCAIQKLKKHFESQIEALITNYLNSQDNTIPEPSILITLVQQLKSLFDHVDNVKYAVRGPIFNSQNILQSVFNKVGYQNNVTKQLAKLIDMYFKCKLGQDCNVKIISGVIGIIIRGLSEDFENGFVSSYQKDLFKRLLLNKQVNLIEEVEIAEYINSVIRHKNSSIIELIKDVSRNKITTINLGAVGKSIEFKSLILDSSVWANMLPDESFKSVMLPSEFQNELCLNRSSKGKGLLDWTHYKLHRLTIMGQFSENREIPINCNMLQAIIILSFNDNDKMSFDQLQEKTKLESNLLKSILNTFSTSANRILLYKNDQITYNRKFKSKSDVVNLPIIKDNIKMIDGSSRETSIATEEVGN